MAWEAWFVLLVVSICFAAEECVGGPAVGDVVRAGVARGVDQGQVDRL